MRERPEDRRAQMPGRPSRDTLLDLTEIISRSEDPHRLNQLRESFRRSGYARGTSSGVAPQPPQSAQGSHRRLTTVLRGRSACDTSVLRNRIQAAHPGVSAASSHFMSSDAVRGLRDRQARAPVDALRTPHSADSPIRSLGRAVYSARATVRFYPGSRRRMRLNRRSTAASRSRVRRVERHYAGPGKL